MTAGSGTQASARWRSLARSQCKTTQHGDVLLIAPQLVTPITHLLALVLFHLLLQESSCALAQLCLLPLHRKAALLLPLCCRCCKCMAYE